MVAGGDAERRTAKGASAVVARPATNIDELTHLLVAVRRELDGTLDALSRRSDAAMTGAGAQLSSTGEPIAAPATVVEAARGDPIAELGVIGCILGLR